MRLLAAGQDGVAVPALRPAHSAPPGTTYSYDALGRTIKILLADGASYTTYIYQGNFTTVVDTAGKWKQYANDALGNLVTVLEPDPTANPGPPATPPAYPVTAAPTGMLLTSYTYDQVNHLTQMAMPRNTANGMKTQTRTFAYTPTTYSTVNLPALWLTSATNPENGATSYSYNADGTLASTRGGSVRHGRRIEPTELAVRLHLHAGGARWLRNR